MKRIAPFFVASILMALLAGCGGGGSGQATATSAPTSSAPSPTPVAANANQIPITVSMAAGSINMPTVSVTVCSPGSTTNCQTIQNVLLDTGSTGLRLAASSLKASILSALPQQTTNGQPVAECAQFGIGNAWGGIRTADIRLSGEVAAAVPIQIVNDAAIGAAPAGCPSTVSPYGKTNGILGISVFQHDCGIYCAQTQSNSTYYSCANGTCSATAMPTTSQVVNPIAAFPTDNNGTLITMDPIAASGQSTLSGTLTFGIGTQTDNAPPPNGTFYAVSPSTGYLSATYAGQTLSSFFDTGSNVLFFQDDTIAQCSQLPGYYCPPGPTTLSAKIAAASGGTSTLISFTLNNAQNLSSANPTFAALPGIGYSQPGGIFGWGMPFYFGRTIATAIEGRNTPVGIGPGVIF